jgi:Mg2+/Co2+ transporter CorB
MDKNVYYIHEDDTLSEALHAFFTTNHSLFVVVNSFEEYVGIVSIESIIEHLLGHIPGSDFTQYADVSAVARRHSRAAPETGDDEPAPVKTDEEVVE